MTVLGRRRPDTPLDRIPDDLQPGDFWRCVQTDGSGDFMCVSEPSNLTGAVWMIEAPNGAIGTLTRHTVREHEDGMISVLPNDGSSNSIAITKGDGDEWHGYIYHGEWRSV